MKNKQILDSFRIIIEELWEKKYNDFFEVPSFSNKSDLVEVLPSLLSNFEKEKVNLYRKRCGFTLLSLALAARPLLSKVLPADKRPDIVIEDFLHWEKKGESPNKIYLDRFPEFNSDNVIYREYVYEALIIFRNLEILLYISDSDKITEITIEAIEEALCGDAIWRCDFKNRGLFKWFLFEVIPSAYYCEIPSKIHPNQCQKNN